MSAGINPGTGLEVLQVLLASNQKLNSQELPAMLTHREVNTLEKTRSSIHSKLRRQQNSRLPINRLPQEILILIATHLSGYKTLINLTHVCTHWRRVITSCPTFWTDIRFGGKDMIDSLANLFFERTKECASDVHISPPPYKRGSLGPRWHTIPILSPGKRIRTLRVACSWNGILEILDRWADALFPLESLDLNVVEGRPPSHPTIFLGDALTVLRLTGYVIEGLDYIRAPNLTALDLFDSYNTSCPVTTLFDILEATPALEEVSVEGLSLEAYDFPPPNRRVTLPHVRLISFALSQASRLASHLICPSLTDTYLADAFPEDPGVGIFLPPWYHLPGQLSVEMIYRIAVCVSDEEGNKDCSLRLYSPSGTTFKIGCRTQYSPDPSPSYDDPLWTFPFSLDETLSALLFLPLDNVVALSIDLPTSPPAIAADPADVIRGFAELFKKCPMLQEVVLEDFPPCCLSVLSQDGTASIQVLTIKYPGNTLWEELAQHVTEVAQIRHSRGVPLERIEIITKEKNLGLEGLERWVQEVKYRMESPQKSWRATSS